MSMQSNLYWRINVSKISIVSIIGGLLILIGLVTPWFTFSISDYSDRTYWEYKMSPFTLIVRVSKFNDPFHEITGSGCHHFYGVDTTLMGIACVIGAVLGFVGGGMNRLGVSFVGGFMALLTILFFMICLPGHLPRLTTGWGISISTLGAIIMVSTYFVRLLNR